MGPTIIDRIFFLYYLAFNHIVFDPSPIVNTENGKVQGFVTKSRDGRDYYSFLNMPYAKPPIGDLRFEPPQPLDKRWEGVRGARTIYGHECVQIEFYNLKVRGQEDCLHLNVFTPKLKVGKQPLPVMVFIHGGGFVTGSGSHYIPKYLMDEDIVFVAPNFRLGALGFLNTGDKLVRGNMGLKDQVLALKWIQKNIANFGGDPNRVTLVGESSGAACVHFHMMSPLSKGLFHGVISQSGLATAHWSVFEKPRLQAQRFASILKCPTKDSAAMIKCLKKIDSLKLGAVHLELTGLLVDQIKFFVPTIEAVNDTNTFLAEMPADLIRKGQINKVPWIAGANSEDGLIFSHEIFKNHTKLENLRRNFPREASHMLDISFSKELATLSKIEKFYANISRTQGWSELEKYTNLLSDRNYFIPEHQTAEIQSVHAPVYLYSYALQRDFSFANVVFPLKRKYNPFLEIGYSLASNWAREKITGKKTPSRGVCHADELLVFFPLPTISDIKPNSPDYQISKELVKLWVKFAYNAPLTIQNVLWTPMNSTTKAVKYLKIDRNTSLIDAPFQNRLDFWKSFPKITELHE